MSQPKRPMPVRSDLWQPDDMILEGIIRRCLAEAESEEGTEGGSTLMGGGILLAVIGVLIFGFGGPTQAAILIPLALGGAGLAYMVIKSPADRGTRHATLAAVGGPGRLPAGYLVHAGAWEAGMAEHVSYLPESQLQAAVQLCRTFPGTVDDLVTFTGSIAAQVPPVHNATPDDVERRAKDLVRIGAPIVREFLVAHPPKALPEGGGKKGKK